ncbi:MAG: DUF2085 domain-containing protein [Thermoplasmata archaeon]
MKRYPLLSKMVYSKILFAVFIISLVWTIAIFLAPATLPPGEVTGLSGLANQVDYADRWAELPLPQAIVYYIGDAECHQIQERSYNIAGNQMPVCARDVGIFVFATLGLLGAMIARRGPTASRMLVNLFPAKAATFIRERLGEFRFLILVLAVFLVPIALDGGIQLLTEYESTNPMRLLTGSLAGWIGGFLFGALLISTKVVTSSVREFATSG